jgi:cellulose biosynthesis protein BcsQ
MAYVDEEEMQERVEEMRNNIVRVLNRVHELEDLEDFADSIELVLTESDTYDTIMIDTQDSSFILTIEAVSLE